MSQIDFSIVIPSRERPYLLKDCLTHIAKNTSKLESIEAIVVIDTDDTVTDMFVPDFEKDFQFLTIYTVERFFNIQKYLNYAATKSCGRWIWAMNDDAMIETRDWDLIANEHLNNWVSIFGDNIICGCPATDSKDKVASYAEFPIISRDCFNILNKIMDERCSTWGGDVVLNRVFRAIERLVDLSDIKIRHVHHNGEHEHDHIRLELEALYQKSKSKITDFFTMDITNDVEKLKSAIDARQAC